MTKNVKAVTTSPPASSPFPNSIKVLYQQPPAALIQQTLQNGQGVLSSAGALVITTGKFTGRSPENRFISKENETEKKIDWNKFNIPIEEKYFLLLKDELLQYLSKKGEVWIRDCYACAHPDYHLNIRVYNETPADNLFVYNMFLRPADHQLQNFIPEWQIIQAPGFKSDPGIHGTKKDSFTIISFRDKTILIGGTGYTGEIKKAVFSVLNFILPLKGVLSMHCSANLDTEGVPAIFFGLSGTGKTTLSSDPSRRLLGDDEHGWTDNSIFNFEGGCYAKTINLDKKKEPGIFSAIKYGALLENVTFISDTNEVDLNSNKITENTRVSYPLHYIGNSVEPSIASAPKNIFFLSCDAAGILPPISKLTPAQAMYYFISGYTSKIAGTEEGITEPVPTFSACFGAPFLPLHPGVYAELLGAKLKDNDISVWLINTGWINGPLGIGNRVDINHTRAMISAALKGQLLNVGFQNHPIFGISYPLSCPGIPETVLIPGSNWANRDLYYNQAGLLAQKFIDNFQKYAPLVSEEILDAGPVLISLN